MFETLEHTWTMLLSKGAHFQSLENHYLTTFGRRAAPALLFPDLQ